MSSTSEKSSKTTIALTGGNGFIGQYLTQHLPYSMKRLVRSAEQSVSTKDVVGTLSGELKLDSSFVPSFVAGSDVLLHLASSVGSPRGPSNSIIRDFEDNVVASIVLFEQYCIANPGGHIIFASSGGAIYDPRLPPQKRREDDCLMPASNYGIIKMTIERYLSVFAKNYGMNVSVLRIGNPYGALLPLKRAQGLIGVLFSCLLERQPLPVFGDAAYMTQTVRDYIHLSDLLDAIRCVIDGVANRTATEPRFEVYNVGTGQGVSNQEVLNLVERASGQTVTKIVQPGKSLDSSYVELDIRKIQQEFGFTPKLTLEDGIRKMWDVYGRKLS
jgi:UDP-glucose 4-epimerase